MLGFAYNVILMYYCIYVYIGDGVCAASWSHCSRGPGYVRRGFPSSCFLVSGGWGWGVGSPVVLFLSLLLLCVLFWFCKYEI